MKTNFYGNLWSALIALAAVVGLAVSLSTFSRQQELQKSLFNKQQDFQKNLEKEIIKSQILKETRDTVVRNGSRINVIVLLELSKKENLSKDVLKELLTLQTVNVFNYLSIKRYLSSLQQGSLDKNLESIGSMFEELIDNQYPPDSAKRYGNAIYSFSEGIVEELDKILLEKEDIN